MVARRRSSARRASTVVPRTLNRSSNDSLVTMTGPGAARRRRSQSGSDRTGSAGSGPAGRMASSSSDMSSAPETPIRRSSACAVIPKTKTTPSTPTSPAHVRRAYALRVKAVICAAASSERTENKSSSAKISSGVQPTRTPTATAEATAQVTPPMTTASLTTARSKCRRRSASTGNSRRFRSK